MIWNVIVDIFAIIGFATTSVAVGAAINVLIETEKDVRKAKKQ